MEDIKKIAVFGSNSFTGSHFVDYALQKGIRVIGISRSPEYKDIFLSYAYKKPRSPNLSFHQLDVNRDLERIIQLLDEEKPEVVVNYAAQGFARDSWFSSEHWYQTNCLGVVRLADMLKKKSLDNGFLKMYLSISTPEVYGTTGAKMKESTDFKPSTPYAISKLAGDLHLAALHKKEGFPVVFTRSSNVYGIHQQLYRIIPKTIISLKKEEKITLNNAGKSVRSFIHVQDMADATWKAITLGKIGEVYHFSPDEASISIKDIVKLICDKVNHDFENSVILLPENKWRDPNYDLDSTKARTELNWRPNVKFAEGLKETISWINDNWGEIKLLPTEYIHKE